MESFFDFYELYKSSDDINGKFINNPNDKTCRFCQKSYPDVSFDNIPHIVPELFGKNNVTSNFECDSCNKDFQKYESDTSTMILHYLALLSMRTKNGIPVFQSKKDIDTFSTTLKTIGNNRNLNFGTNLDDFKFNEEEKTLTVKFRTRNFRPFSVYKVFLKIAISLLNEDDLKANQHFLDFLHSEEPINNGMQRWTVHRYMFKAKYFLSPYANLYKAKNTLIGNVAFPEYVLLINFANVVFQFFLPISYKNATEHKKEHELRLELFPAFVLDDVTRLKFVDSYMMELNEMSKVSVTDKIVFHYDGVVSET